jgi:uncharacterized membrane-anchored protein
MVHQGCVRGPRHRELQYAHPGPRRRDERQLAGGPEQLDATLPGIKTLLKGFSYTEGQKYSEWKSGDKIAKYGLSALVVGGAVGVAAKLGLLGKLAGMLGKLWKLIIVGIAALGAGLKGLLFGKKKEQAPPADTTGKEE